MQLDRVRRYPGLAVVEVEERDARYACPRTRPRPTSGRGHLEAVEQFRPAIAVRGWRLRDHLVTALGHEANQQKSLQDLTPLLSARQVVRGSPI